MKILLLSSHSPFDEITGPIAAGAETAMRHIAEGLAERNHEVHYLTLNGEYDRIVELNGVKVHLRPEHKAKKRQGRFYQKAALGALETSFSIAERVPLQTLIKPYKSWLRQIITRGHYYLWGFKRYIEEIVIQHNIDLIHCFSSTPDALAAAAVANKLSIPLTLRMGGRFWYLKYKNMQTASSKQRYKGQLDYVFANTDLLVFNSRVLQLETEKMFHKVGINSSAQEMVLDIGVKLQEGMSPFAQEKTLDKLDLAEKFVVSCIGKFKENSKRQDLLIRCLPLIPKKDKILLIFAGGGPTLEKMMKLAETLNVTSNTLFLGDISRNQVFDLLKKSHILAHPTDFEGSSKAVAEAMVLGKPVLASDIPPLREHIANGETGVLSSNTPEAFASQISRLFNDSVLREKLSENAKKYGSKHFDPSNNIVSYEKAFQSLIDWKRQLGLTS